MPARRTYLLDERRKLSFLFVYISLLPPSHSHVPPTTRFPNIRTSVEVIASSAISISLCPSISHHHPTHKPPSPSPRQALATSRLTRQPG
ncbi:hypothetical protein F4680DRAFT_428560 [Xylaria scruposa]|nr:hypothetical protein F4680DRAFT_428560 [Xylaria scruposa]